MITAVTLDHFRGVATGELADLTGITVLVGTNGTGKSTVLDGLLLAGGASPGDALGRIVRRRSEALNGASWLGYRGWRGHSRPAVATIARDDGSRRSATCRLEQEVSPGLEKRLRRRLSSSPFTELSCVVDDGTGSLCEHTAFGSDNQYKFAQSGTSTLPRGPSVWLIEPQPGGTHAPLSLVYSRAALEGQAYLEQAKAWVTELVPGLKDIQNLTPQGTNVVFLIFDDHSIPVGVAGDGVQALVRIAFELAGSAGDTVLIEEPEAHQHPRALYYTAQAIAAAQRKQIQVILSTHSLELIDQLILAMHDDELPCLSVRVLRLDQGELLSIKYSGSEVRSLRDAIGKDFR